MRRGLFAGRFPGTLPEGSPSLASGIPGGSLVVGGEALQARPLTQELPSASGALRERRLSWEAAWPPLLSPRPVSRAVRSTSSLGLLWVCASDFPVSLFF